MGPITEPCGTPENIAILFDLTVFQDDSSFVDCYLCFVSVMLSILFIAALW